MLGNDIYEMAQRREDEGQEQLLSSLVTGEPGWALYVAHLGRDVVGFIAIHMNTATLVGEIGLNAVEPSRSGRGVGSAMYAFALEQLKQAGMQVAVVATGADPSHEAARRAYRKVGFLAEIPSVWMCRKL